jgi:hypothetical protein
MGVSGIASNPRSLAVQLCVEEGFPVAQVARDLRIGLSTLGK